MGEDSEVGWRGTASYASAHLKPGRGDVLPTCCTRFSTYSGFAQISVLKRGAKIYNNTDVVTRVVVIVTVEAAMVGVVPKPNI